MEKAMTLSKTLAGSNLKADLGAGLSTKVRQPEPPRSLKHEYSQASRALGLGAYFLGGCLA